MTYGTAAASGWPRMTGRATAPRAASYSATANDVAASRCDARTRLTTSTTSDCGTPGRANDCP